jgi:hypothetical protein
MPDDDVAAAGIGQHRRGNVAGMGAGRLGVAVLGPERDRRAGQQLGRQEQQGRRRADQQICRQRLVGCPFGKAAGERQPVGLPPVHLPIAGDQRPRPGCHGNSPFAGRVVARPGVA